MKLLGPLDSNQPKCVPLEMEHPSQGDGVEAVVKRNAGNGSVSVNGRITALGTIPQTIRWIAAAPTTRGIGFSGSGQPYPNKEIAYSNTPHSGEVKSNDGSFQLTLKDIPAGYFTGLGSIYVPPVIEFETVAAHMGKPQRFHTYLWITDTAAPYRWISGSPATLRPEVAAPGAIGRAMYYIGRETMPLFDNQEAQLRAKGYEGDMTERGWPSADDAHPFAHVPSPA